MLQARLNAAFGLVGDGVDTSFVLDLNSVPVSVSNGQGGISFSSLLSKLLPDSVIDATASSGTVSASINKNKLTVTLSPAPSNGLQVNVSVGLGFNSL